MIPAVGNTTRRPGRVAPPQGKAPTPTNHADKLWTPKAPAQHVGVDLWTLMTAEELGDMPRPRWGGLEETTASGYWRFIQQIYEEMGHDLTQDPTPWETAEPPWRLIYEWRGNLIRAAGLKGHQQALTWLCALWGLDKLSMPTFLRQRWHSADMVDRARALGLITTRARFFTPDEIRTLLASWPFTDQLRTGYRWNDRELRKQCEFKDRTAHAMVLNAAYCAQRPGEMKLLRAEMYDSKEKRIMAWPQEKKSMRPRNVVIPEVEVFSGDKRRVPSLESYMDNVRPGGRGPGPMWQQIDGTPYAKPEKLLRDFINLVLGPDSPGPHGFRRFAATWAYHHSWTEDAICKLVDDEWKNVTGSYLDRDWLSMRDRQNQRSRDARPPREVLRSNGNRTLYRTDKAEKAPVPEFSSGNTSGSVQNGPAPQRRIRQQTSRKPALNEATSSNQDAPPASPSSFPFLAQPALPAGGCPA